MAEVVQTRVSDASQAPQQQSGAATPLSQEVGDPTDPHSSQSAGLGMEKNYTDTIASLLSELWKERLVRSMHLDAVLQYLLHKQDTVNWIRPTCSLLVWDHTLACYSRPVYS